MYQKIMVPVDESQVSMRALLEACKLAQSNQAQDTISEVNKFADF